jgi:hypothetical protein
MKALKKLNSPKAGKGNFVGDLVKLLEGLPIPVYSAVAALYRHTLAPVDLRRWKRRGRPIPPPQPAKWEILQDYARRFGLTTLVETGTYRGSTIAALRPHFRRLISVELSPGLYEWCNRRFHGDLRVQIHQGDSAEILSGIVSSLQEPALFWLDSHYSGGATANAYAPTLRELEIIFGDSHFNHVALIDDAVEFTGQGYPTIECVREKVMTLRKDLILSLQDNIIRVHRQADGKAE